MVYPMWGLTTSQFATAPKQARGLHREQRRLTTSQFATAPKHARQQVRRYLGLTTSQFATAPKQVALHGGRGAV